MIQRILISHVAIVFMMVCALSIQAVEKKTSESKSVSRVTFITSDKQFNDIIETAGNRLLMFDLYADWCGPCRMLSPTIEKIAVDYASLVSVYKINIDNLPDIAQAFGVRSIPLVVFIKNKQAVNGLLGLQPPEAYVQMVTTYGKPEKTVKKVALSGTLDNGVRTVKYAHANLPEKIVVKKGEQVKFVVEKIGEGPVFDVLGLTIDEKVIKGQDMHILFTAETTGTYSYSLHTKNSAVDSVKKRSIVVQ